MSKLQEMRDARKQWETWELGAWWCERNRNILVDLRDQAVAEFYRWKQDQEA